MAQVNYVPDPSADVPPSRCSNGFWTSGSGSPTCAGFRDQFYLDIDTGDVYQFQSGAWVLVSSPGGGGGAGLTYHQSGDLDPNGVITGSVGDVFHSRVSLGGDGTTWWKVAGNGTNTNWE